MHNNINMKIDVLVITKVMESVILITDCKNQEDMDTNMADPQYANKTLVFKESF